MNTLVQSFGDVSKLKIGAMIAVSVLMIAFFVLLATNATSPSMAPIYTNLSLEDSSEIVAELEQMGVPYDLSVGGKQILVAGDKVEELRVKMAGKGLPSDGSGMGYEIFDNTDAMGTSNFILNVNKVRALEGELARTIGSIKKINSARVHLVIPKRELFTRERREPTASVVLNIRGNQELDKQEIAAIQHLVATSVTGLKPTRITIVDDQGRMLARGVEDENDPELIASKAQDYRANFEKKLEQTILALLERSVGVDKAQVEVNADIDFDRIVTNEELYDPEGQVARSVQSIEEVEQEQEKDLKEDVSVQNNLPDQDPQNAGSNNSRNLQRTDETTNFEISKTVRNHIKETGNVKRLSVAVLVDGVYTTNEEGVTTYAPRSEEELAKLETLVRSSVGYDANRGDVVEVVNMEFAGTVKPEEESPFDWLMRDFNSVVQTLVLAGIALLVILQVIKPLVNKAIAQTSEEDEDDEELQRLLASSGIAGQLADLTGDDDDSLISIDKIAGGVKSSVYRKINELLEHHPEESLGVLRSWAFEVND
ncbi:MAG: flagellar M-ring protein FliF [Alphaproteobacteria bacterium]|nr:MAG: flagellar M-ring protein FliF [Alphaproteobacteria bacterium]TAF13462.1 MAG: flagellar M-ring protein FliF [Alphaproteobacteria bacterium]TAF76290.1 MAG: flagellar M-ring protein FliF [Alphaproteobacteria bacterium]